jgi:hypothetical protein
MRYAPPEFLKALDREFHGQFRCRWSPVRHRWQVEQKVGTGTAETPLVDDQYHDDWHRVRDGYVLYAEIAPGTLTPCPHCGADMKAEPFVLKQIPCGSCANKTVTGFFPLGEALLTQLRSTDPNRGGYERNHPKILRAADAQRKRLKAAAAYREARACGVDDARFYIPKVGATNRESMWLDAPVNQVNPAAQ